MSCVHTACLFCMVVGVVVVVGGVVIGVLLLF